MVAKDACCGSETYRPYLDIERIINVHSAGSVTRGHDQISDGTISVNFHPGATVRRELDKTDGLFMMTRSRQSLPKARDFKRARDIFQVETDFKDSLTDYQNLWNMAKEQPHASTFTFTWGIETFTVVIRKLVAEAVPDSGSIRGILCVMEIVTP